MDAYESMRPERGMRRTGAGRYELREARAVIAFVLSLALTATVWGQPKHQAPPGAPDGPGGAPTGQKGPGGMPGGPGGGNLGAAAMTKAPVVSAAQLRFADFKDVRHKDAVETVFDFGLMGGCTAGNKVYLFCPRQHLTLGELAKAVALSTQLVKGNESSNYIAYCIRKGLYKGTTTPDMKVTGNEVARMLLAALGVKGVNSEGHKAFEASLQRYSLTRGIEGIDLSQFISRDNAAQMLANALRASDGSGLIPRVLHNSPVRLNSGTRTIDNTRIFNLGGTAVQDSDDSVLVVRDSRIDGDTSVKTKPLSGPPGGLLVAGSIRTTLTLGRAQSFYINSVVNSKNWAALSTDGAKPATKPGQKELALYAYGTRARTIEGGYGTYSDLFCNVYIYGTKITSAEIGAISGTYGKLTIGTTGDGEANRTLESHLTAADKNTWRNKNMGSVITGGRNAIMIHSVSLPPYWGYKGYSKKEIPLHSANISVHGSTLATNLSLSRKLGYTPEQQAYIDHQAGSVIVVKSSNADINLDKVTMKPDRKGTGALIQTVINNDTHFSIKVPDGAAYPGVKVRMTDMKAKGNILNEDYQRDMYLTLTHTSLTGKIVSGTVEAWNAVCRQKGFEKYIINPDGYKTRHGVNLTLHAGSVWRVTGKSTLTALTIGNGATVTAPRGERLIMTVDGLKKQIKAGIYKGKIVFRIAPAANSGAQA